MEHHSHTRRGAHRTRRDLSAALLPSLLAIAAVVALIVSLLVWRGEDVSAPSASAGTGGPIAPAATAATTSSEPSATPSVTKRAATTTSPKPATPSAAPTSAAPTDLAVVVLNQTSRTGLAAKVADRLRNAGFTVVATGNFRGSVPATTVYFPDGADAVAQQVAEALPTAPRTKPRFGSLSSSRLTVVVTGSYPG